MGEKNKKKNKKIALEMNEKKNEEINRTQNVIFNRCMKSGNDIKWKKKMDEDVWYDVIESNPLWTNVLCLTLEFKRHKAIYEQTNNSQIQWKERKSEWKKHKMKLLK